MRRTARTPTIYGSQSMDLSTPWSVGKRHFRKLETNDAGKPYAGKPHVRFDEGLETESEPGASVETHYQGGWEKEIVLVITGFVLPVQTLRKQGSRKLPSHIRLQSTLQ